MTQPEQLAGNAAVSAPAYRVYTVNHTTVYRYAAPVTRSSHTFRLRPVHDRYQEVLSHELSVSVPGDRIEFDDVFGNHNVGYVVTEPYTTMEIHARSVVRLHAGTRLVGERPGATGSSIPIVWMPWQSQMMLPYLLPPELVESELHELAGFAREFVARNDHHLTDTLLDMTRSLFEQIAYQPGATHLETTPYEVYTARRGVCQDFANLLICLARLERVPARYRVGYLHTGGDYQNHIQAEASHAWAEVYLPRQGWRGLDPTNGIPTDLHHIRVACGRNYRDATPTAGVISEGGGGEELEVAVRVELTEEGL